MRRCEVSCESQPRLAPELDHRYFSYGRASREICQTSQSAQQHACATGFDGLRTLRRGVRRTFVSPFFALWSVHVIYDRFLDRQGDSRSSLHFRPVSPDIESERIRDPGALAPARNSLAPRARFSRGSRSVTSGVRASLASLPALN